jgi:hypothetical protein
MQTFAVVVRGVSRLERPQMLNTLSTFNTYP